MPSERTTSAQGDGRGRSRAWAIGLFAVLVAITLIYGHWAQRVWWWQPDELEHRAAAEWFTGALPQSIWALEPYGRGIQRLAIWNLGGSLAALGSPDGFRLARWIQVAAFVSTAIPVWLWARAAGASRGWAGWGALAAIVVPWAVIGATFLTEPIAYPLTIWACFATWRTAVRPSVQADLVAIAAVAAAALARTALVQLGVVLAVVCLVQDLRLGRPGLRGLLASLRAFPRRHVPICAATAIGSIAVLAGRTGGFTGVYGDRGIHVAAGGLPEALSYSIAVVGTGTAFVPLVAALALTAAQLVRPTDGESLALGLIAPALLAVAALTASLGGLEERYVFFAAAVGAVAAAAGATRRETPVWSVVLAGALIAAAVLSRTWRPELGPAGFLAFTSETFQARVVNQGLYSRLPNVLEVGLDPFRAALVLVATAAAAVLVCPVGVRGRRGFELLRLAVPVGLLVVGAVQARYALSKFELGVRGAPLEARTWADRAAHGDRIGVWLPPLGASADYTAIWQEERFFNVAAGPDVRWRTQATTAFTAEDRITVGIDPRDGRLLPRGGARIPRLMLVPRLTQPVPLLATPVAQDARFPVDLVRFRTATPRVRWIVTGADPDGWIGRGARARVRVFPPFSGSREACVRLQVEAPPDQGAPRRGVVAAGGAAHPLVVTAAAPWHGTVRVPVRDGHGDLLVRVAGGRPFADGRTVSGHLSMGDVVRCPPR